MLKLKIITPEKQVLEEVALSINCHTVDGEITVLPRHVPMLTLLTDGVITVKTQNGEKLFSAGSGYIETNGENVRILISSASGQEELNEKQIIEVQERAKALLKDKQNKADRSQAFAMLRRATVDLKVLRKVRSKR
jgi:F-type H+-transporting ATPase subunit epsilon